MVDLAFQNEKLRFHCLGVCVVDLVGKCFWVVGVLEFFGKKSEERDLMLSSASFLLSHSINGYYSYCHDSYDHDYRDDFNYG